MPKKKLATIDIKGKEYVTVATRILDFNDTYKEGFIITEELPSEVENQVKFKATVTPDASKPERKFTGHSQAVWGDGMVNKTSALENAETSAVGRALAMMGIGIIESVASVDEINKTTHGEPKTSSRKVSAKQVDYIVSLLGNLGDTQAKYEEKIGHKLEDLSSMAASKCIETLKGRIDKGDVERDEFDKQVLEEIQQGDDVADEYKYKAD